jgi:hypothetical protein
MWDACFARSWELILRDFSGRRSCRAMYGMQRRGLRCFRFPRMREGVG